MSTKETLPETEIPLEDQLRMAESMIQPAWRNVAVHSPKDRNYRRVDEILDYTGSLYRQLGVIALEGELDG